MRRTMPLTVRQESRVSTLIAWGEVEGYTAMAKTVGIPTAVSAQLILNGTLPLPRRGPLCSPSLTSSSCVSCVAGTITLKGVAAPLAPEIYEPVMKHLADEGIKFLDNSTYSYA